jgi:hypothetical protein
MCQAQPKYYQNYAKIKNLTRCQVNLLFCQVIFIFQKVFERTQ